MTPSSGGFGGFLLSLAQPHPGGLLGKQQQQRCSEEKVEPSPQDVQQAVQSGHGYHRGFPGQWVSGTSNLYMGRGWEDLQADSGAPYTQSIVPRTWEKILGQRACRKGREQEAQWVKSSLGRRCLVWGMGVCVQKDEDRAERHFLTTTARTSYLRPCARSRGPRPPTRWMTWRAGRSRAKGGRTWCISGGCPCSGRPWRSRYGAPG